MIMKTIQQQEKLVNEGFNEYYKKMFPYLSGSEDKMILIHKEICKGIWNDAIKWYNKNEE